MKNLSKLINWLKGTSLITQIAIGLTAGVVLGLTVPQWTGLAIFGKIFVSALKAVAPILVAVLVVSSVAKAGGGLGPRFRIVIIQYFASTFIAAACAVACSAMFPVTLQLTQSAEHTAPLDIVLVFENLVTNMVSNPITSLSNANYIGILFWSLLMGAAMRAKATPATIDVVSDIADVVSYTVKWIIRLAPVGIMGLVFQSVSESGLSVFTTYGELMLLLIGCMLLNALVFNPLISFSLTHRNPYPLLFRCLRDSGFNAFFTRSSAANIPVNMELCRKLGLNRDFYSVSIPLGAMINMAGAAITITVMSLAVANTVGVQVNIFSAVILCIITTLAACGCSGVAGGSLLLVPMACSFLGIDADTAMQAVAIGFIIGVVQDSVETAINSSSDVFFTATAEYYDRRNNE